MNRKSLATTPAPSEACNTYAVLGVLARIDLQVREATLEALDKLAGVSLFEAGDEKQTGVLVEGTTLEEVHDLLIEKIQTTPGVLSAWPIYSHFDNDCHDQIIEDVQATTSLVIETNEPT